MNLEKEIKINKILLILLITLSVGTIALRTSHAMFSKKETFNNVLRIITGSQLPSKGGAEDLIEKAGDDGNGFQGINPETGTLCTSGCKEYRYTGASVKNYVKLTNLNPKDVTKTQEETWRIIGVFIDEDTNEKYMRIVRDEVLSESYLPINYAANGTNYNIKVSMYSNSTPYASYWNFGGIENNNWSQAGIQYYLNGEEDASANKGYMSYLSEETKSMLRETKHYLGTHLYDSDTTISSYKHERDIKECSNNKGVSTSFPVSGCNVWNGNDATWSGKISLMYPSDVGFAASKNYWSNTKLYNYSGEAKKSSWMFSSMKDANSNESWLISPADDVSYDVSCWEYTGAIEHSYFLGNIFGIRPVLNIKSNVKIKKGTEGTKTNPYIFEI